MRSWIAGRGHPVVYMRRFYSDYNQITLGISTVSICPRCADVNERTITDPLCPVCYGTGYEGGYGPPVTGDNSPYQRVYAIRNQHDIVTSFQAEGIVTTDQEQQMALAMTGFVPRHGDLVIDLPTGNRFFIDGVVSAWSFNDEQIGYNTRLNQQSLDSVAYMVPTPYLVVSARPSKTTRLAITGESVGEIVIYGETNGG